MRDDTTPLSERPLSEDIEELRAYAEAHGITLDLRSSITQRVIRLRMAWARPAPQPTESDQLAPTKERLATRQVDWLHWQDA